MRHTDNSESNLAAGLRPVHWTGSSKDDLRKMPEDVKDEIGTSLLLVQCGGKPDNAEVWRGFTGASVLAIHSDYETDTYRCVYTVRFAEAVYVLHAFQKKSHFRGKTPQGDRELVARRLQEAEAHYRETYGVQKGGQTTAKLSKKGGKGSDSTRRKR